MVEPEVEGRWRLRTVALLSVIVIALYAPVLGHELIELDDNIYVWDNPYVRDGFTAEGVRRALFRGFTWNWHPITWLSHMLDGELYGVAPMGHHATNLLLHVVNTSLLFFVMERLTKRQWASAGVACAFAVHPCHVEAVAWISARKDLLCLMFGLLTVLAYARFTERRTVGRYAVVLLAFAASLLSKPMLVTLPVLLLFVDLWPLRAPLSEWKRAVLTKVPLLLMSAGSAAMTIDVQRDVGAMQSLSDLSVGARISSASVAYAEYLSDLVWPNELGVMYVHPNAAGGSGLSTTRVAISIAVLSAVTVLVIVSRRRYAIMGWAWFLISGSPTSGIMQVGGQPMADRYCYVMYIGLFVMIAFALDGVQERLAAQTKKLVAALAIVWLGAMAVRARVQVATWQTSETVYRQAILADGNNILMRFALAMWLMNHDRLGEAESELRACHAIDPHEPEVLSHLGIVLVRQRRIQEANEAFALSVVEAPNDATIRHNHALGLWAARRPAEACAEWTRALAIDPGHEAAKKWSAPCFAQGVDSPSPRPR